MAPPASPPHLFINLFFPITLPPPYECSYNSQKLRKEIFFERSLSPSPSARVINVVEVIFLLGLTGFSSARRYFSGGDALSESNFFHSLPQVILLRLAHPPRVSSVGNSLLLDRISPFL